MEYQTAYELLMQKLQQEGRVETVENKDAHHQQQVISQQMEEFEMHKQFKAAHSQKDLATIVLTA